MGDTCVIDMSHYDYAEEDVYKFSKAALKLWAYFGSIEEGTVGRPPLGRTADIRCRRRPRRVPCSGVIESEMYEQIRGMIEWDEMNQGMLPLVVTDEKQWSWLELGRELMTYEGFKITIEIT
jgi:hypothetical protein